MRLSILKMSLMWWGPLSAFSLTVANWERGSLPACLLTTNIAGICECGQMKAEPSANRLHIIPDRDRNINALPHQFTHVVAC